MSETAVKVENLSKSYRIGGPVEPYETLRDKIMDIPKALAQRFHGGHAYLHETIWALKDISFKVKEGNVLGIIGPNGAGKTTLLKVLSRITEPTEGQAIIRGRVGSLLEVGTGFHPELTGRENIYLNGAILGMKKSEIESKFDEIVDFSGVEKFIDTPVKRYSSGMRVRLAFSVAAHLEPEILLVDEVLAVGDAEFQQKCLGKMQDVTGQGRTVLFISHNMASIEALCHRAILLEDGRIAFEGDSASAVANYLGRKIWLPKSYVNLREHPGQTSKRRPIFQSIRLLNQREEETAIFHVGEGIVFEMILDAGRRRIRSPRIFCHLFNRREQRICTFDTNCMVSRPFFITGKNMVRCYWDECMLVAGNYSLTLMLKEHGDLLETVKDAINFEVRSADVYKTGKPIPKGSVIIPRGKWKIKPAPE